MHNIIVMTEGCRVLKKGVQNWKDWPKNQQTQRKLLNVENWCQKVPKFDFQIQFSTSKISGAITNLGAHFLSCINYKHFLLTSIFISLCY